MHHADGFQAGVGWVGKGHAGLQSASEVLDNRLGDPLAGEDDGNAGRVWGDLLGGDPSHGVLGFDVLELAEERVPGDGFQFELRRIGDLDRLGVGQRARGIREPAKRADQVAGWLPRRRPLRA